MYVYCSPLMKDKQIDVHKHVHTDVHKELHDRSVTSSLSMNTFQMINDLDIF